jgi:hypothetical protein
MKTASMIGSVIVIAALAFYSSGYFNEKRNRLITSRTLLFYTTGLILDMTATAFMIIGSTRGMMTLHGIIGYSSLLGMLIDTSLLWRHNLRKGPHEKVNRSLHLYSTIAYSWWVIAFITGGALVLISKIRR